VIGSQDDDGLQSVATVVCKREKGTRMILHLKLSVEEVRDLSEEELSLVEVAMILDVYGLEHGLFCAVFFVDRSRLGSDLAMIKGARVERKGNGKGGGAEPCP